MKKVLLVLFLMVSLNAYAACNEGREITGKNGHVYCGSKVNMNWYTAFMWCEAQGRTLATMPQVCDIDETQKWDGNVGTEKCLNLIRVTTDSREFWTATPYDEGSNKQAFHVVPSTGLVGNFAGAQRLGKRAVLCW